jgi:hypothetical protein
VEGRLQAFVLARGRADISLQKRSVRLKLGGKQVWNIVNVGALCKRLANALLLSE